MDDSCKATGIHRKGVAAGSRYVKIIVSIRNSVGRLAAFGFRRIGPLIESLRAEWRSGRGDSGGDCRLRFLCEIERRGREGQNEEGKNQLAHDRTPKTNVGV